MLWTWLNIKIYWFLTDSVKKNTFRSKKDLPKNYIFKKISNFWYFLSPEALSNSPKVQISQNRRKKLTEKCKKSIFLKIFKKSFFGKDLLNFLLFYLIHGLSPHIHLFFQLSSCTGWSTIRDFRIFQKTAFLPFFGPLCLSCGVFFDKISSPLLFLTLNRGWECCLTSMVNFQPPPKNWQSSVTKFSMCAFFLADTVHIVIQNQMRRAK